MVDVSPSARLNTAERGGVCWFCVLFLVCDFCSINLWLLAVVNVLIDRVVIVISDGTVMTLRNT